MRFFGFALRVLASFRRNQGLLLSGAVAYYMLLSILPLLMLLLVGLSQVVPEEQLLAILRSELDLLVPTASDALVAHVEGFLRSREIVGWIGMLVLLFFSTMAFTVLENAMSVIFHHRVAIRRRHFLVSAVIPYCYILSLGFGLLLATLVAGTLQAMGQEQVEFLGRAWSLDGASGAGLYLLGVAGEIFVITSIYMVMPVGRLRLSHALVGAVTASVLWELTRHALVWYFATLSQIGAVYGSLTTAIIVLLSLEVGSTLLLLGAQVLAEFERIKVFERPPRAPLRFGAG